MQLIFRNFILSLTGILKSFKSSGIMKPEKDAKCIIHEFKTSQRAAQKILKGY